MGVEVELKFRVSSFQPVEQALQLLGATVPPADQALTHRDLYWNHPHKDFVLTREALRFRQEGDFQRITYKGPRLPGVAKTREEWEIDFDPSPHAWEALVVVFERLGFRPVAEVHKQRRSVPIATESHPLIVTLDDTGPLGCFIEIEAFLSTTEPLPAETSALLSQLQSLVLDFAKKLGLREDQIEPRSYLRMKLEWQAEAGGGAR